MAPKYRYVPSSFKLTAMWWHRWSSSIPHRSNVLQFQTWLQLFLLCRWSPGRQLMRCETKAEQMKDQRLIEVLNCSCIHRATPAFSDILWSLMQSHKCADQSGVGDSQQHWPSVGLEPSVGAEKQRNVKKAMAISTLVYFKHICRQHLHDDHDDSTVCN